MRNLKAALLLLLCLLSAALADRYEDEYIETIRSATESLKKQSPNITDHTNLTTWSVSPIGYKFDCPHFNIPRPGAALTVNELTPYDIKVVGALGDSITAAFGAKSSSILDLFNDYRGVSWSIGGDGDLSSVTTLPNIIKEYNPYVKGFSEGKGPSESRLNVAISGAIAEGMPGQTRTLIDRIKSDPDIDFENDWKLVTLWIGGNNLCRFCINKKKHSPENYAKYIGEALDILHSELPRTFVNLVQIIDVTRLTPVICSGLDCYLLAGTACSCAKGKNEAQTSDAASDYQEALNELISSGQYNTRDDFTVVIQPFFEGIELPYLANGKPDKSYFAPDCFHFSTKGHREGAVALWNNMFENVGSKTSGWTLGGPINCPDENDPYLKTTKNSNLALLNAHMTDKSQDAGTDAGTDAGHHHVAIVTGSCIGVSLLGVAIIVAVVIAVTRWRRQQNLSNDSEHTALISNKL